MVVARASGTDLASSLKQNTFLTLKLCPARVCRCTHWTWYLSWGGYPLGRGLPPIKHPSEKDGQLVPVMGGTQIWYPTGAFFMGYPTHERYRQSRGDVCFFCTGVGHGEADNRRFYLSGQQAWCDHRTCPTAQECLERASGG